MNISEIYIVEFSLSQRCFHVDTMEFVFRKNIRSVLDRTQSDWIMVGISKKYNEATDLVDVFRKELKMDDYTIYTNLKGDAIVL